MENNYVIVTRHPALAVVLREDYGIEGEVIAHATPEDIEGRHVVGVLPLNLAALAETVTSLPMRLPPELRGVELSAAQVREFSGQLETYRVTKVTRG